MGLSLRFFRTLAQCNALCPRAFAENSNAEVRTCEKQHDQKRVGTSAENRIQLGKCYSKRNMAPSLLETIINHLSFCFFSKNAGWKSGARIEGLVRDRHRLVPASNAHASIGPLRALSVVRSARTNARMTRSCERLQQIWNIGQYGSSVDETHS